MSAIKVTKIDGDVNVGRNVAVGGDAIVQGNTHLKGRVRIDGWLDVKNIKGFVKGLFPMASDLRELYPKPEDGWVAFVGPTLPAQIYIARNGRWIGQTDSEGNPIMGGSLSVDPADVFGQLEDLKQEIVQINQRDSNQDDDIETLGTQDAELLKRIQGTSENSKPYDDPFKLVRIVPDTGTALDAFNAWLDGLHPVDGQSDEQKKAKVGFFRVIMSGLQYEVHNFISSWADNVCRQVLLGIVGIDDNGAIQGNNKYNILQRLYDGEKWSEWEMVSGAIQAVSINGKTLPATKGKVDLSVDGQLNEQSTNPVQNTAVAKEFKALGEEVRGKHVVLTEEEYDALAEKKEGVIYMISED